MTTVTIASKQDLGDNVKIIAGFFVIVFLFLLTGCDLKYGFLESELRLSTNSRLPKFISLPNGIKPNNVLITITIYSNPISDKAKVEVFSQSTEHKRLYDKVGSFRWHPLTEKKFKAENRYDIYPQYIIIKVDNIEETFEKRTKNDTIYVVDQPQ